MTCKQVYRSSRCYKRFLHLLGSGIKASVGSQERYDVESVNLTAAVFLLFGGWKMVTLLDSMARAVL